MIKIKLYRIITRVRKYETGLFTEIKLTSGLQAFSPTQPLHGHLVEVVPLFLGRERRLIPVCGGSEVFLLFFRFRRFSEVNTRDFSAYLYTHSRDSIFRLIRHFFQLFNKSTVQECFPLCEVDIKVRASRPSKIQKISVSGFVSV